MVRVITALLLFCAGCYSVPVVKPVDTVDTQAQSTQSAQALRTLAEQNGLPDLARPLISRASQDLDACSKKLGTVSDSLNTCSKALAECKARYESARDNGGGLWARFLTYKNYVLIALVAFGIGTAFGRLILSMLWAGIQAAVPALRR